MRSATAFRENLKCLVSGKFEELCSTFLDQNITPGTYTLNSMFETTFDRVFDDELGADIQTEIGAIICPLVGRSTSDTVTVRNFLRMLIKKTINPPQIRPDEAFDHLCFGDDGEVRFAPTAPSAHYDTTVCNEYMVNLVRNTLQFVDRCTPNHMHIITDAMAMDVATYVINDIAYGQARRNFEQKCDARFDAYATARGRRFRRRDLTLMSTLKRITGLVRSQIVEGIVVRCTPVAALPPRIKIHLPSAGDVYMLGRALLCDVKKHTRACTPGDDADGKIRKKDGSGEIVWDMCPELTGYLCPYPSSTDNRIDIVFTPGHTGNVGSAPGYVYATVDVADAVSPVLKDALHQIASFLEILLPLIHVSRTSAPRDLRMAANTIATTFLREIIADARATSAFAMVDDVPTPLRLDEED